MPTKKGTEKLEWETRKVKVKDLVQLDINPRKISEEMKHKLSESLTKFNFVEIPALEPRFCQVIIDRMRKLNPDIKITKNGNLY